MIIQHFKTIILAFVLLQFYALSSYAQEDVYERHIQVAIRMIGHEILLNAGDSNSRVLPIEKEKDRYRLQFEKDLQLSSEFLVSTIDSVVKQTSIANSYLVQVEDCESGKVVYSYEMGSTGKQDLVPCINRMLPKACYQICFTILEPANSIGALYTTPTDASQKATLEAKGKNYLVFIVPFLALLIFTGLILSFKKKKKLPSPNPDIIPVGAYQFNIKSMELCLKDELIELSSKEADLLRLLLNSANNTVERDYMLKKVWGDEGNYIGRTLDVFISKLRKKLEADTNVKIVNVRGVGYKLVIKEYL